MARARNIKPSFFDNDELGELPPLARLLFIGMWTIADYKGDFEWRTKRIKAKLLPYDDCSPDKLAINLDQSGFIRFYSDGGKIYCRVVNFSSHQNPHKNERDRGSEIPEYHESMRQVVELSTLTINREKSGVDLDPDGIDPADSPSPLSDSLGLIPDTKGSPPNTQTAADTNGASGPEAQGASAADVKKPKPDAPPKSQTDDPPISANPPGVTELEWRRYLDARKSKKHPMAKHNLQLFREALAKACSESGMTPSDALAVATEAGWRTIQSAWLSRGASSDDSNAARAARLVAELEDDAGIFTPPDATVIDGELA